MPGVDAASAMTSLPLDRQFVRNGTEITGNTASSASTISIDYQRVMSGFFETTGIPILQGRHFQSTDAGSDNLVAVVNETLARMYWNGRNPIGQRLRPGGTNPWFTVVGVAKDVKQVVSISRWARRPMCSSTSWRPTRQPRGSRSRRLRFTWW